LNVAAPFVMYYKHLKNLKEKTFFASVLRLTNLQNSILKFKQLVAVQNTRMCPGSRCWCASFHVCVAWCICILWHFVEYFL